LDKKKLFFIFFIILNFANPTSYSKINLVEEKSLYELNNIHIKENLVPKNNIQNIQFLFKNAFQELIANLEKGIMNNRENINAAEIKSDIQINNKNFVIAKGNVFVNYKNMILKSDELKYNRKTKVLTINGGIQFKSNDQFFEAAFIKYDLKNKVGFIENIYGSINFDTLDNIASEKKQEINKNQFQKSDRSIKNIILNKSSVIGFEAFKLDNNENDESFIEGITPQNLKVDINEMQNWRFISEKINIDDELWSADKLYLTNDPFNKPQLVINNSKFKTIDDNGEIIVKSGWSSIKLDDFLTIPVGPRSYSVKEKDNNLKWNIGYDENSKDGLFISRKYDTIFSEKGKTSLDLKQVFLIQRALLGKTKSYSKKNDPVLSKKVKQNAETLDYIGFEAELNSKLIDFDFYSNIELSSLDFEKLNKIIRVNSDLSKVIYQDENDNMKKKTILSIFGNYREKVWNGSLGEIENLSSYGTKIQKSNIWIHKNVIKTSKIGLGYGNYEAGRKNDQTAPISRKRLNFSLNRNHFYPIWQPVNDQYITQKNIYSPNVIPEGIILFAETKADFYRYDDNNLQNLYTIRGGPIFTFGNFKKKYLDYTKFSVFPKATLAVGESPFAFDQAYDNHGVEFAIEQQIIGPVTFKLSTEYNLDINSPLYREFYNKVFEIAWNRRAYNISAYYNESNKSGGINFKIHSFSFNGFGESFK